MSGSQDEYADEVRRVADPTLVDNTPIPYVHSSTQTGQINIRFTMPLIKIWPDTDFSTLKYQTSRGRDLDEV